MNILSVFLCIFASLNRKLRTAVQTAEAHGAFFFDPYGLTVFDFDCIFGAVFCTYTAAGAGIFNRKSACTPEIFIVFIEIIRKRYASAIKITVFLFDNLFYDCFSRFVGFFVSFRNLVFIR